VIAGGMSLSTQFDSAQERRGRLPHCSPGCGVTVSLPASLAGTHRLVGLLRGIIRPVGLTDHADGLFAGANRVRAELQTR